MIFYQMGYLCSEESTSAAQVHGQTVASERHIGTSFLVHLDAVITQWKYPFVHEEPLVEGVGDNRTGVL